MRTSSSRPVMLDTILNLLFRCAHKRTTRPMTPVSKAGGPPGDTYVVCLECGKQFAYDLEEMRIGKVIQTSPTMGVLDTSAPAPSKNRIQYAVLASVLPVIWLVRRALRAARAPKT